ncbi:unnamed protein product [Protopolystoma xenopodis]|uniref:Uncharacterized protein n=1 Tax=Protopolystoma xenopodis TaxID=117903 RepID=A0A448X5L8_9PLAT|nr:unnamed protein product [Protopolystoma xenopodis]
MDIRKPNVALNLKPTGSLNMMAEVANVTAAAMLKEDSTEETDNFEDIDTDVIGHGPRMLDQSSFGVRLRAKHCPSPSPMIDIGRSGAGLLINPSSSYETSNFAIVDFNRPDLGQLSSENIQATVKMEPTAIETDQWADYHSSPEVSDTGQSGRSTHEEQSSQGTYSNLSPLGYILYLI